VQQTVKTPDSFFLNQSSSASAALSFNMKKSIATKIAELINARNQLNAAYDADRILRQSENYIYELDGNTLVVCVEVKKVQWYQWEICRLSVNPEHEGKGRGARMLQKAEEIAHAGNAKIVQCTIRIGVDRSERAFLKQGYLKTISFYNRKTENYVAVWQKAIRYRALSDSSTARGTIDG